MLPCRSLVQSPENVCPMQSDHWLNGVGSLVQRHLAAGVGKRKESQPSKHGM